MNTTLKIITLAFLSLIISATSLYLVKQEAEKRFTIPTEKTVLGTTKSSQVNISANIGLKTYIRIYGYTSPLSYVFLTSTGLSDTTLSEQNGYFNFIINYAPENLKEVCLNSSDQFGRTTNLTCLPILLKSGAEIGPIILSPTLSLSKPIYLENDEILISGQTIPNQKVTIKFFKDTATNNPFIKSVFAQETEKYAVTTDADNQGNYSFSLKKSTKDNLRIAGYTIYNNQKSPLSYTLRINSYNWWYLIDQYLKIWLKILKNHLLEIFFILEAMFIYYLIENKAKNKITAIQIYKPQLPAKKAATSIQKVS
ncbi:MAG: hypothetical protein KatS3mg091_298 [Patescibacteria group bacterium]|nr:MAG: hypothetical protein KatS3mg091_298 [Patescibacteria group bacterium]